MRKALSISIVLLILLQSFSKVWIIVAFKINQQYISSTLCINRNKPEKACNGKCYLRKQLKADEGENEHAKGQLPQKLKKDKEVVYYVEDKTDTLITAVVTQSCQDAPVFTGHPHSASFVRGIFHPPDILAQV